MSYFSQAGLYLVQVAFGFYILLVLLRFLFQLSRADFYNPISQFIVTLTNPPLLFLRRFIPGLGGIDLASVVLLVALQAAELWLIHGVIQGVPINSSGLILLSVARLLQLTVYVYIVAVLIRVILSWVNPYGTRHPVGELLNDLTDPLLIPARRLIPAISGLDLSPIAVFVLLQLTLILVVRPLEDVGIALMLR